MNEEEKKTIEKFIEKCYKYDESVEIKGISVGEEYRMLNTVCKALNLIEKLQKENEELKEENEYNKILLDMNNNFTIDKKTGNYKWNVIEIQKVKDKIEELKQERDETYTKFLGGNRTDENLSTRGKMIEGGIKVLQELLEESDE